MLLSRVPGAGLGAQRGQESRPAQVGGSQQRFRGVAEEEHRIGHSGFPSQSKGGHDQISEESNHGGFRSQKGNLRGYTLTNPKGAIRYGRQNSGFSALKNGQRGLAKAQNNFVSLKNGRRGYPGTEKVYNRRGRTSSDWGRRRNQFTSLRQAGPEGSYPLLGGRDVILFRNGRRSRKVDGSSGGGCTSLREGG